MITYPELGRTGQLGNQYFEIAATISVAVDNGESFGFPRWSCSHYNEDIKCSPPCHMAYDLLPVKSFLLDKLPDGPSYREPHFHYAPIPYQPNLRLGGYFQSEKYFKRHAGLIRALLTPISFLIKERAPKTASIHITMPTGVYTRLPLSYYEKAIDVMKESGVEKFVVFCFDPVWCARQYSLFDSSPFRIVEAAPLIEHLVGMMLCEHHIIANSTFSWWAAWLDPNPRKKVICPGKNWFSPAHTHNKTDDLFPEEWIRIE